MSDLVGTIITGFLFSSLGFCAIACALSMIASAKRKKREEMPVEEK